MKINKLSITIFIVFIAAFAVFAETSDTVEVSLTFGDLVLSDTVTEQGFTLDPDEAFILSGFDVPNLYFITSGDNADIYFSLTEGGELTASDLADGQYLEIIVNLGIYEAFAISSLEDAGLTENDVSDLAIGLVHDGFVFYYTGDTPGMIEADIDGEVGNWFVIFDDKLLFKNSDGELFLYDAPVDLKFLSPPSLEELQLQALEDETKAKKKASDRVKIHVNAHTFDLGEDCVDVDADEADPLKVASYAYTADEVLSDKCQYDSITDKYVLSEAVCVDGELLREEYPCGDNEVCQDGKCGTAIQDSFCVDTDQQTSLKDTAAGDLSSVFETKGATAGYYAATSGQSFGIWADYCATANLLVEYSCQEKKTRFTTVHCKGGCIEANCQAPFCYDTDGADNPVIYGMIRGIDETGEYEIEDVCMDDLTLVEYYCDISEALGYGQREVQCSDPCSEGSCIPYGSPLSPDTTLELEMPESFSCDDDADCDFGKICVAESCTAGCRSDLGCMIGNRCVNNECVLEEQGFNNAIIKAKLQRRLERMEALEGVVDSLGGHPIEKEIKSFASSKKGFLSRMITRFF